MLLDGWALQASFPSKAKEPILNGDKAAAFPMHPLAVTNASIQSEHVSLTVDNVDITEQGMGQKIEAEMSARYKGVNNHKQPTSHHANFE